MKFRHLMLVLAVVVLATFTLIAQSESSHEKLYILHSRSNTMSIVDVATNKIIKTIEVGKEPHGIATPKSRALLYVSTEGDGGLTLVDTSRDEVVKKYGGMGLRPQEGDITPDGRFLYMPSYSGYWQVFDTQKEEIVSRIFTKGLGHNTLISPDGRHAYLFPIAPGPGHWKLGLGLPTTQPREITVVDTSTHQVVGTIPLENASRPPAFSTDGKRLFSQTDNLLGFVVIDVASRKAVSKATYTLTPDEQAVRSRSHGIAALAGGKEVWSNDVNHNVTFVFDVTVDPPKQIARLALGASPYWVAGSKDGKTVYVSCPTDDVVIAFDAATKTEKTRLSFPGKGPKRIIVVDAPRGAQSTSAP